MISEGRQNKFVCIVVNLQFALENTELFVMGLVGTEILSVLLYI